MKGQEIFEKPPFSKCTREWIKGRVSDEGRGVTVEIDGFSQHVLDVRSAPKVIDMSTGKTEKKTVVESSDSRQSARMRKFMEKYADFVIERSRVM